MFAIFVLLWIISVLLIYANPKTPWAFWGSVCLFLNGFGGVAVIIGDNIIPHANNLAVTNACFTIKCIADIFQHYFATYAFTCFALYFTNFLDFKISNLLKNSIVVILSIPSILTFIVYPRFEPSYIFLSAWVVPYTLIANAILIISTAKEKDQSEKNQKILVCVCVSPTTLFLMWTSYLSVAMGYDGVWELNVYIILLQFIVFVVLALKYGILGIRLRVERCNLDDTIDSVIGGMSIISHAIKNESATINLCADTIRASLKSYDNIENKLNIIKSSCRNLSDFARKINEFRIYDMDLEPYDLYTLSERVIAQVTPLISGKDIKIINLCKENFVITLDVVHVSEVLKNLIINAIEAINNSGIIKIETGFADEKVYLSVIDNGIGIPPESIEKVLTPFYSTKKGKNNFGLGLSYCYKVMKCHKGNLKISSNVNQGTRMTLLFPVKKVVNVAGSITAKAD
ncbi:histidine kinase/DNA gyrase B/HSP90-like ATPase [Ruminiclostridium sufflavum DSM 19573]|uniref:histidine kinase n=1 Tax=Ruminiclostridium sufflavum DSM 19573 TaxID=1121337 RepID=A0A318XN65_9FIRM|nr:HAMP domain-containing sensor histidine kinase [Ruminiclostridium sufflavum]PYG88156.1 histidine kinase/DNA gyrase B/HSP90-like ATPase [Ruminiclostridium sufflavum DSM 19573]